MSRSVASCSKGWLGCKRWLQFSGDVVSCEVRAEKQHLEVKASDAAERVQEQLRDAV